MANRKKKTTIKTKKKFGANADFIRSQPDSMSAKEISDAAAKRGLKISVNHVYNLRAAAEKKQSIGTVRRRGRKSSCDASDDETQFSIMVANIGLKRARELLDGFEAALIV